MSAATVIFVIIGVGFVSSLLMKGILWLDEPRPSRRPPYAR